MHNDSCSVIHAIRGCGTVRTTQAAGRPGRTHFKTLGLLLVCLLSLALPLAAGPPEQIQPLTQEQAAAALKKVGGKLIDYEKIMRRPATQAWMQSANLLNDDSLKVLAVVPNLWRVDIVYPNQVTDAGMQHLAKLSTLQELNLEGTEIGDAGLEPIGKLAKLEWLSLIDTNVTGAGLVHLKGLSRLRHLKLSFTEVDDAGLVHLETVKSLRILELDDTKVTRSRVESLQRTLPQCKILASSTEALNTNTKIDLKGNESVERKAQSSSSLPEMKDWPQWRGPNRDGVNHETGLLQEWPAEGPTLRWEAAGIGWGFSTVVTQSGIVYATGQRANKSFLTAIDETTGKRRWELDFAPLTKDRVLSTPTIDGPRIYALSPEGVLACIELGDRKVTWRRDFVAEFGGKFQSQGEGGGFSESVLIDGDKLICTPGGPDAMLVALDKMTGATIWQARIPADVGPQGNDRAGFSSPVISDACGVRQYVQNTGCGVVSVSPAGKVLWTYNRVANKFGNIPTPIVRGDLVFASNSHASEGYSGTALLKVTSNEGTLKAEEVYRLSERVVANHHGGMILVGDYVYMGHGYNRGFPLCLEFTTGKVMWRPGRGAGTGSASLAYADGRLYFHYEDGTVALVDARPDAYVLRGKFKGPVEPELEWSHPVVNNGNLFIRGQNKLRCYDVTAR